VSLSVRSYAILVHILPFLSFIFTLRPPNIVTKLLELVNRNQRYYRNKSGLVWGIWCCMWSPVLNTWCIITAGIAAKRQPAGIKFTHRPKIRFFVPQGRLVAPIQVKLGRADGHLGPLGCAKFHLNRHMGWECGPQNIKNFHFLGRLP